ncbi:4Fe-4S single cluster domain-containing protein [Gordonia alkaliphila]|uniref:4Fe-4S cluster-binding domain-containing protein n=1 Tax=Gordonia alkaliphila TaxID=1053547 RepID=A0ABP8ZJ93_9ACTN
MTSLALSRVHFPVTNLGTGRRIGVWLQGCTVHCPGCVSVDTWAARPEHQADLGTVLDEIAGHLPGSDGLTVSGGEPTDQPEALTELLTGIRALTADRADWDVLVYTGRSLDEARTRMPRLDELADVVISEPFLADATTDHLALRGSSNQVVTPLSDLGRRRYPPDEVDDVYGDQRDTVGVCVEDGTIWLVGIPRPGDLQRMETALARQGVEITRRSWLS